MAISDKRSAQFIKEIDGKTYLLLPFSELNRIYNSDHSKDLETILSEIEGKLAINLTDAEAKIDAIGDLLAKAGYSDLTLSTISLDGAATDVKSVNSVSKNVRLASSGAKVPNIEVEWNIEGTPLKITLADTEINKEATSAVLAPNMAQSNIGLKTFNITFTGSIGKIEKTIYVYVVNDFYYGVAPAQSTYDATFLSKLSKKLHGTFYRKTWTTYTLPTVDAGVGEYIFIALPKSVISGDLVFVIGGFDYKWTEQYTFHVTNSSGATEEYVLFKSDNPNLGKTAITLKNNQ